jgi:hypothetical protein
VLDRAEVVYVAYASPAPVGGLERSIGTRLPAYATAIGRVLLAGLAAEERLARLAALPPARLTPCTETDTARLLDLIEQVGRTGVCLVDQELRLVRPRGIEGATDGDSVPRWPACVTSSAGGHHRSAPAGRQNKVAKLESDTP